MSRPRAKLRFRLLHDFRKHFKLALRMARKRCVIGKNAWAFPWRKHVVPLGNMNRDQHKRRTA